MTKFTAAQQLAELGFYVFRLKSNAKTPARFGWQQEATRDETKIKDYFDNNKDYNIGIFTEKYDEFESDSPLALTVVDVDTKDGKQGNQTMQALDAMGCDFPPTMTITTASGGKHLIYTNDVPLASGANKIGPHVDLKSAGAYIVGAGSTIDGIAYRPDPGTPQAPAAVPGWLPLRCHPPLPKSAAAASIADDSEQAISRATILAGQTEASAGGRNDQAFKLGCQIRDYGLSQPMTEEILQGWNSLNVSPPLNPEEITHVTNSVYQYAKLDQGNKSPQAEFEPIPHDPKIDDAPVGKPKLYRINWNDIKNATDMKPLIRNYLDQDSVSIGYGDSNAGKTFVFLDLAYHVAAGKEWAGHKVTRGGVIYLAAEGGRSMSNRIQALKQTYQDENVPFTLIPCQINLLDSQTDFKGFVKLIEDAEKDPEIGLVRLIVIDTLSRAMHGGNENDSVDMGKFVTNITFIKERFHAHILIVHHSGKDTAKGARGHSLLRAAVDTELEIVKTDTNQGLLLTKKQRDMEFARPLGFKLNSTQVGTDADNQPITSCIVTYHDAEAIEEFKPEPRDTAVLMVFERWASERTIDPYRKVIPQLVWMELCKDCNMSLVSGAKPWPKTPDGFKKAFYRARDRLEAFGLVEKIDENQWGLV